jgi:hypothetical protein
MYMYLKDAFDDCFRNVKWDRKLVSAIYHYQIGYINRNQEHIEFFGSKLLGVHVVRFKDSDVARFYSDVLDVDFYHLTEAVRKVPTIYHEATITSDIFNLTLMYMIHRFLTERNLDEKLRKRAAYDAALIFFYRCAAALQSATFRYPADPKIAQAAYSRLSKKFLIKQLGSWYEVMEYRANDLLDPKEGIHYENLVKFTDDLRIIYAIQDSQGRIKDLMKNYYNEFKKSHAGGESIGITGSTFYDVEGEETLKEKTKSVESYVLYIQKAITDKATFVQEDLVSVIANINKNTSFRMVKYTLSWMSDNYYHGNLHKDIDRFITTTVIQSMYLMNSSMDIKHKRDYPKILTDLKNLYLSTRTTDPEIEEIRDLGLKLMKKANPKVSESLLLATRTSVILYITLRALVGQSS